MDTYCTCARWSRTQLRLEAGRPHTSQHKRVLCCLIPEDTDVAGIAHCYTDGSFGSVCTEILSPKMDHHAAPESFFLSQQKGHTPCPTPCIIGKNSSLENVPHSCSTTVGDVNSSLFIPVFLRGWRHHHTQMLPDSIVTVRYVKKQMDASKGNFSSGPKDDFPQLDQFAY